MTCVRGAVPQARDHGYDRDQMRKELVRDEGLRLKTYRCTAGYLTIGVGRNLDANGIYANEKIYGISLAGAKSIGITHSQAMRMLDNDIDIVEADLDRNLPWWRTLDPVRQRVMVNMAFNLGITRFLKFKNTLRFIRNGEYQRAANGMKHSLWYRQVKSRAVRLQTMMATGRT